MSSSLHTLNSIILAHQLDPLAAAVFRDISQAEVSQNPLSAYRLSNAGVANSGYSFGWIQFDLSQNGAGTVPYQILQNGLQNINVDQSTINTIMSNVTTAGSNSYINSSNVKS